MDLDLGSSNIDTMPIDPVRAIEFNISGLVDVFRDDTEVTALSDPVYEQFLADVWVGIVLTLMVLSCVCFMCSCLIYHKFQEWKQRVIESQNSSNPEAGSPESELPSYTIASGLPTYEEALEQLKKVNALRQEKVVGDCGLKTIVVQQETSDGRREQMNAACGGTPYSGPTNTLSVFNLFGIYTKTGESRLSKPS